MKRKCEKCKYYDVDIDCEPCCDCSNLWGDSVTDFWESPETNAACDPVNHPAHYNSGNIECIDAMLDVFGAAATKDFCLLSAFKYIWRCRNKGKEIEDIKKADWYLNEYLKIGGEFIESS